MTQWATKTAFPNSNGIFSASMTAIPGAKILVAGGEAITDPPYVETLEVNCYLYDTNANSWSVTGSLHTLRVNSQAVLLGTGKVLTIGGRVTDIDAPGLDSCELYDVGTGLWTVTGSLNESRYGYGFWILNSGDIMVAGGNGGGGIGDTQRKSTEIYSVSGGTWANTGHDLPETLEWPYFFSLSDGTPIVAGGNNTSGTISVYKYSLSTGWSLVTTYPVTGFNATSEENWNRNVILGNGKLFICATNYSLTDKFAPTTDCFLYDPIAQTMVLAGSLNFARTMGFQIPTHSGAFVSCGLSPSSTDVHSVESYNTNTNTWTVGADNPPTFLSVSSFCKVGASWYQLGGEIENGRSVPTLLSFTEAILPMSTYNDISAASGVEDFHQHGTTNLVIEQGASEPGSPVLGQLFYNTTTHLLERYNGSAWIAEVSSIHADSNANITGNVQLISGSGVTLSQTGSAITVNATGGATGGPFQVIQATSTTRESTASTTFVASSFLTLFITPSSAAHRVKLTCSSLTGNANNGIIVTIFRNAVNLGSATFGFGGNNGATDAVNPQFACVYVDSPATTSATTYTVNFRSVSGGTVRFGQFGGASEATGVLIAEEIPA